jgi:hypothetical protein
MRVLVSQAFQEASRGIAFAIVFGVSVAPADELRGQGNDLLEIGMNDSGAQHLKIVTGLAASRINLLKTAWRVQLFRGKIAGAVERQNVVPIQKSQLLQGLAPLELAKNRSKRRPKRCR